MRQPPAAPPERGALTGLPAHVVVRAWPETLVPLRRAGVDLARAGDAPLSACPGGASLVELCLDVTSWREAGT